MDCIGSCAFGVETNAMGKDIENNPFKKLGSMIFEVSNVRGLSFIGRAIWPSVFYGLGMKVFPVKLNTFFNDLLTGVFKSRNYEASSRNDFIDLVLNLKKNQYIVGDSLSNLKSEVGKKISLKADDELMVAQCMSFFAAGFETSATTLSYTIYELAKNKQAQNLVAEEVKRYLQKHKRVDYSCVTELPYSEACIDEALRLYPVLGILTREVVEDYTLPSGLLLSEGLRVHIPVYHLHHDPRNFPDPHSFKPERFLPENKHNIKPYTYMPFGEGQRICIGMRFAKMQMLAGLVTLLNSYSVELAPGMPREVELEPRAFVTQPTQGIHLKLVPREKKLEA
ncbi:cytochrome p450 domain-containing protein [Phthorimaea operculella]|nr:cytochrome p450 domain-containing protein [Phthorimaea operculella]